MEKDRITKVSHKLRFMAYFIILEKCHTFNNKVEEKKLKEINNTKENFILRPEYFGGLLICRNTFTKWELDMQNMIYLWFFYHYKDVDLSIKITKLLFGNDALIESDTIQFSLEVNNYSIPSKWICRKHNKELQFAENMLEELKKLNYLTAPLEMSLYITSKCQLNCNFCFMHNLLNSGKDLELNQIKYMVDIFVDNGIESISLLGGEPLLHPDFVEICEYINEKRVHFVTTTNGLMINEELLKKLRNFEYLSLVFSIQSIDDFNRLRTGVDPSIIMNNIKLAQKHGLSVRMNTVLTDQTYSQIEKKC